MVPIQGLFEAHMSVRDLDRAVAFYRDVVGLEVALVQPERGAGSALLWVGGPGRSMLGLFSIGNSWPLTVMQHHVAFQVSVSDLLTAVDQLHAAGVPPLSNRGAPITEPIVFGWMPAASVFFHDPDGNLLEYIAMLPDPPDPEAGVVTWSAWQQRHAPGG